MTRRGNAEKAGRTRLEAASATRRWLGMEGSKQRELPFLALFSSCGSTLGKQAFASLGGVDGLPIHRGKSPSAL